MLLVMTLTTLSLWIKNTVRTAAGANAFPIETLTTPGRVTTAGVPTETVVGIDYLVGGVLSTFPPHVRGPTFTAKIRLRTLISGAPVLVFSFFLLNK